MIDMMDNLPAANCEALCMTELEGLSQKEYAERNALWRRPYQKTLTQ